MGHCKVKSLPIYPLRYEATNFKDELLTNFENRGRAWVKLVSNLPACFEYCGRAILATSGYGRASRESFTQVS
jgi:hypothetical protein